MTLDIARKAITIKLEENLGIPVVPTEHNVDIPSIPYCRYSILATRIQKHENGLKEVVDESKKDKILVRSEEVSATMSITLCSRDRGIGDEYVNGEEEALLLTEKAVGFFLLDAHNIETPYGEIVINEISSTSDRTTYEVDNYIKRYGFDIKFSFVRVDRMKARLIEKVGNQIQIKK